MVRNIYQQPKKENALSSKLVDEMIRLFAELKVDENVRGIIDFERQE